MLIGAVVADQARRSCEQHRGSFSEGFSTEFDIDRIECRPASTSDSPTLTFWGVSPYVGIEWRRPTLNSN